MSKKPFQLDVNLDDEAECRAFIASYGVRKGKDLAFQLGFVGEGSERAATALSNYAWNRYVAFGLRKRGGIKGAKLFEAICDNIYKRDIKPLIECW